MRRIFASRIAVALSLLTAFTAQYAGAQPAAPLPVAHTAVSPYGFDVLATRLEKAIEANKMALVAQASASRGAAARGVKIPGNLVLMVFRNDYAVRMLAASVPAGVEAPLRLYVTEDANGKANGTGRAPSAVFAPYGSAELNAMARELDPVFEKIVRDATGS